MTAYTEEQLIQRGAAAQHVLENEIYRDAYAAVDGKLIDLLRSADLSQDKRTQVNNLLIAGSKYRRYLEHAMQEGEARLVEFERKQSMWTRKRA